MTPFQQRLDRILSILSDIPQSLSLKLFEMDSDNNFKIWLENQSSEEPYSNQIGFHIYQNRNVQLWDGIMLTLGYLAESKQSNDRNNLNQIDEHDINLYNNRHIHYRRLEKIIDKEYQKYQILNNH